MNIKDLSKKYKIPQKVIKKIMRANNLTTKNQSDMKELDLFLLQKLQQASMAMRDNVAKYNNEQQ